MASDTGSQQWRAIAFTIEPIGGESTAAEVVPESQFEQQNGQNVKCRLSTHCIFCKVNRTSRHLPGVWPVFLAVCTLAEPANDFLQGKLNTARFYFERLLPRRLTLAATIRAGAGSLMAPSTAQLAGDPL